MAYYFFSQDIPIYLAERMYGDISHATYVKWFSTFRSCVIQHSNNILHGEVETALQSVADFEIDESYFGKRRKYNKGALTNNVWVHSRTKS